MAKFYSQHPRSFLDMPISELIRYQRRTDQIVELLEQEARRNE